jgi:hypothetical protein
MMGSSPLLEGAGLSSARDDMGGLWKKFFEAPTAPKNQTTKPTAKWQEKQPSVKN